MSLEARLRALADDAFPPTPDLAARWAANLGSQPMNTAQWRRWRVVAAVAALVLIPAGAVAAVELWGPENVRVRTVEVLPPAPAAPRTGGEEVETLAQAADRAGFEPFSPSFLDAQPQNIRVRAGVVTFEAGEATVTQVAGRLFIEKTIGPDTTVEPLTVDGAEAYFLSGAAHDVIVETASGVDVLPRRRAGNTLVYERDGIVTRVEGLRAPPRSP